MRLSVIIPVYNTPPEMLIACFDSIVFSNDIDWEAIVVDDGSTELTASVCRQYVSTHPGFQYVRQENRGVSSARNTGLAQATGEYILFVDADDHLLPQSLSRRFLDIDKDIVFFSFRIQDGERSFTRIVFPIDSDGEISHQEALLQSCRNKLNAVFAKLFRRSMLESHNIRFDETMVNGEDAMFVLDAITVSQSLYYTNNCIYDYIYDQDGGNRRIMKFPEKVYENAYSTYQSRERTLRQMNIDEPQRILTAAKEQLIKDWFGILTTLMANKIEVDHLWQTTQIWAKQISVRERRFFSPTSRIKLMILRYSMKSVGGIYGKIRYRYSKVTIK